MKNFLAPIKNTKLVRKLIGPVGKFVVKNSATILTGTTIACNVSGIAVTYKNSPKIHLIISDAKLALSEAKDDDEKRKIQTAALQALVPLIAPILLFFAGATASAIINQKRSEAKIAALTAALSLAQETISEYDLFKQEAEKMLGEEKVSEITKEIDQKKVDNYISQQGVNPDSIYVPDGQSLLVDGITNQRFTDVVYKDDNGRVRCVKADKAVSEMKHMFAEAEEEIRLDQVWVPRLGIEPTDITEYMGWQQEQWTSDFYPRSCIGFDYDMHPVTIGARAGFMVSPSPKPVLLKEFYYG